MADVIIDSLLFLIQSLSNCIDPSVQSSNVSESTSSSFSWHIQSMSSLGSAFSSIFCPLVHLSEILPYQFQEWFWVSNQKDSPGIYSFDEISVAKFGFEKFSSSFKLLFQLFSLSFLFVRWCPLPIFPSNFLYFQVFKYFPNFQVLVLPWFFFPSFNYQHSTFLNPKFHSYIQAVGSYILIRFSLVGFYGISTLVGYLMPNPVYAYISNM